ALHPAQFVGAAAGHHQLRHPGRDRGRGRSGHPGPRRTATHADLGWHDHGWLPLRAGRSAPDRVATAAVLAHHAGLHIHRRRVPGRLRRGRGGATMTVTGGRTTARTGAGCTPGRAGPPGQGAVARPTASTWHTVRDLRVVFPDRRGRENVAVGGFSAAVTRGRHLPVPGDSSSGKTVSMRAFLHSLRG